MAGSVLIIEDDALVASDIADSVLQAGLHVTGIATNVGEAVEFAERMPPTLIISDIRLKRGDSGFEAVRKIRNLLDVPVIFVTGYPELIEAVGLPSRSQWLPKPFRAEQLTLLLVAQDEFAAA